MNIKEREKIKNILDLLNPVGKPKVTLVKFNAKEIKKGDLTRFKNLWIKLKTKVETIDMPIQNLKGRKVDIIIVDEQANLHHSEITKLHKLVKWKNK